jgi:hypothetical protein
MGVGVIRFRCPNCGHPYEVLEAMAGLPLICKRCRGSLRVPWPSQTDPTLLKRNVGAPGPSPPLSDKQADDHIDKPIDEHATKSVKDHADQPITDPTDKG